MAKTALASKAEGLVILDLRKLSFSFDFFVLCSVSSSTRIQTIADDVEEELSTQGIRRRHVEGEREGGWVLLDYGQVVGHLFSPEVRQFYGLERLWADAPRVGTPHPRTRLVPVADRR